MAANTTFKVIYIAIVAIVALAGYFTNEHPNRIRKVRQADDDGEKKTSVRQAVSNTLAVIAMIGLFGLVFILGNEDELFQI